MNLKTREDLRAGVLNPLLFNPLLPSVSYMARLAKFIIFISEGIINKIYYERPDYESVAENRLS